MINLEAKNHKIRYESILAAIRKCKKDVEEALSGAIAHTELDEQDADFLQDRVFDAMLILSYAEGVISVGISESLKELNR